MNEKENEVTESKETNGEQANVPEAAVSAPDEIKENGLSEGAEAEEQLSDEKQDCRAEAVYAFRWDYSDQFDHDKRSERSAYSKKNKASKRGAVIYGMIMCTVFAVAFAILAVSISMDNFGRSDINEELTVTQIVEKGLPSSVSILAAKDDTVISSGSGFVVNDYGYIVTNYHVVENALQIVITDSLDNQFPADIVGYDADVDLALLYAEGANIKSAVLADSDKLQLGETVVAIGTPAGSGMELSVSNGIVSGVGRHLSSSSVGMIQTNAPLNPGNSGGPLFDSEGNVAGIVTSKLAYTTDSNGEKVPLDGIAYAIPINSVKKQIETWITQDLQSPMMGITAVPVTAGESYFYDGAEGVLYIYEEVDGVKYKVNSAGVKTKLTQAELENEENGIIDAKATGIYVIKTTKGLGAYGKLQKGDIVVSLGGVKVESVVDARDIFRNFKAGDVIEVEFFRNDQVMSIDMTLKTKSDMLSADKNS